MHNFQISPLKSKIQTSSKPISVGIQIKDLEKRKTMVVIMFMYNWILSSYLISRLAYFCIKMQIEKRNMQLSAAHGTKNIGCRVFLM